MIREAGFMNLATRINVPAHINSATRSMESDGGNNTGLVLLGLTLACAVIPAALFAYFNSSKRLIRRHEENWRRYDEQWRRNPPSDPPPNDWY